MENKLDAGFIIISSDSNYGKIKSTFIATQSVYPTLPIKCVLPNFADSIDIKETEQLCPVIHSETNNIYSLINDGITKSGHNWNILIFAGTRLSAGCVKKYLLFKKTEKDILSPVTFGQDRMGRIIFDSPNSINGMMIHSSTFNEIGKFPDSDIQNSFMLWTLGAMQKGYNFKGIVGIKAF